MESILPSSPSPVGQSSGIAVVPISEQSKDPAVFTGTFVAPNNEDNEDDFKLEVNPSLVVIIVTNILMHVSTSPFRARLQVIMHLVGFYVHHRCVLKRIRCTPGRIPNVLRTGHWRPNSLFRADVDTSNEA